MLDKPDITESSTTNIPNTIPMAEIPKSSTLDSGTRKMKGSTIIVIVIVAIVALFFLARKQTPPATITFRGSMLDSTLVMQVTNRSGSETLVMQLEVKNSEKQQEASYTFKVGPSKTCEIGYWEMGWGFEKGEKFSLKADGYMIPISGTIP